MGRWKRAVSWHGLCEQMHASLKLFQDAQMLSLSLLHTYAHFDRLWLFPWQRYSVFKDQRWQLRTCVSTQLFKTCPPAHLFYSKLVISVSLEGTLQCPSSAGSRHISCVFFFFVFFSTIPYKVEEGVGRKVPESKTQESLRRPWWQRRRF